MDIHSKQENPLRLPLCALNTRMSTFVAILYVTFVYVSLAYVFYAETCGKPNQ